MKNKTEERPNGYVNIDVCSEILARLPVKTLLRFRCVCRTWRSLIDSVDFSYMHLYAYNENITSKKHNERPLLVIEWPEQSHYYDPLYRQLCFTISPNNGEFVEALKPDFWDFNLAGKYHVIGHVNGLLCLQKACLDNHKLMVCKDIILWNPSTRKSLTLPKTPSLDQKILMYKSMEFCFGFDFTTKDYKVVLVKYTTKSKEEIVVPLLPALVEIYSHNTGTWRELQIIDDNNHYSWYNSPKKYLNGAIHWLGRGSGEKIDEYLILVSFDVSKEVIIYKKFPDCIKNEDGLLHLPILLMFRGCLAIWNVFSDHSNIWVQNEHGSWIKTIAINIPLPGWFRFHEHGEIILSTSQGNKLKAYNTESQQVKDLAKAYKDDLNYKKMTKGIEEICKNYEVDYIGRYAESLLSF